MQPLSLIYRLLVLHLLIAECNSTFDRLGLADLKISDVRQITGPSVHSPLDFRGDYIGLCGALYATNFTFSVGHTPGLPSAIFTRIRWVGGEPRSDWGDLEGAVPSPAAAYEMGRAYLEQLGIDVQAMERSYVTSVVQHPMLGVCQTVDRTSATGRYQVRWLKAGTSGDSADSTDVAAQVSLNVAKKHLVDFYINERSLPFHRHPPPDLPHAIAISQLPNEPVYQLLRFGVGTPLPTILQAIGNRYTNALALLDTPPAYENRMRRRLLDETRQVLAILQCTQLDDPKPENLEELFVTPPAFGSGGRVAFKNGHLEFDADGRLRSFDFLPRGQPNRLLWWGSAKSLITTNEAYQIATQKLAALSIDVDYLNARYKRYFWRAAPFPALLRTAPDGTKTREWREPPEYYLVWRDTNLPRQAPPATRISVYGDLKEVGTIELNDTTCWKRPPVVVTNAP